MNSLRGHRLKKTLSFALKRVFRAFTVREPLKVFGTAVGSGLIENVYVINLDRQPARWESFKREAQRQIVEGAGPLLAFGQRVSAKERFRLVLAAGDRGDGVEIDRLTQTGGQELRSMSDHARFSRSFIDLRTKPLPNSSKRGPASGTCGSLLAGRKRVTARTMWRCRSTGNTSFCRAIPCGRSTWAGCGFARASAHRRSTFGGCCLDSTGSNGRFRRPRRCRTRRRGT